MSEFTPDGEAATVIDRSTTGKRILYTVVFFVIARLIEAVLAVVVLYQLAYRMPSTTDIFSFLNGTDRRSTSGVIGS